MEGLREGVGKGMEGIKAGDRGRSGKLFGREIGTYKGETGVQRFESFNREFKLSGKNADRVRGIFDREAKDLRKLYGKKGYSDEERGRREAKILDRYYRQVWRYLTPEQRERYARMRGEE